MRDLIRHRNRSKLVQGSLYATTDLLIGAKLITWYVIWRVGGCFNKKSQTFLFLHLNFSCYYCSIDLKRQSEHSGLRPDTSSLVQLYVSLATKRVILVEEKY